MANDKAGKTQGNFEHNHDELFMLVEGNMQAVIDRLEFRCASRKPASLDFADGFAVIGHPLTHGSPGPLPWLVVHFQPSDSPVPAAGGRPTRWKTRVTATIARDRYSGLDRLNCKPDD